VGTKVSDGRSQNERHGEGSGCQRINPLEIAVPNKFFPDPDPLLTNPDNPGVSKCHCSNRPQSAASKIQRAYGEFGQAAGGRRH